MALTPQQEHEIYPILDMTLELEPGKGLLRKCPVKRANYLARMIKGVRYSSAVESIEMYEPGDALYGKGSYAHVWVEPHEQGLLCTLISDPPRTTTWRLIECAATHQSIELSSQASYAVARQRLSRLQKRYPSIMNPVWIENEDGLRAKYADIDIEQLIVVDIDVAPGAPDIQHPTPDNLTRARGKDTRGI